MRRGGVLPMAMVISLSHQARMACYHGGSHKNGSAKGHAEQATAGRQQGDSSWQSSCGTARHPGHCVQLCIIHAWARRVCSVLDVIAISVPAVRRLLPVSAAPSRAEARKLHHAPILPYPALSSSGLPADQSLALRGWRVVCPWEAVFYTLRTHPGLGLAEGFTSGRLFAVSSHWQPSSRQRCPPIIPRWLPSTQLRCVFATAP
jgi:hypothetical protein